MNLRLSLFGSLFFLYSLSFAQTAQNSFWDNWFVQVGADMTLQNPYGYDFSKVFPNGKSFGVDAAVGKWFTPEIGLRAKVNWENGIGAFENSHLTWLAPFDCPGMNMEKGGYLSVVGDILFDAHNILLGYDSERFWNMQLFLRAGGVYNYGAEKGSPLVGAGIGNTFRINDRWRLYADLAYNGVSSGFSMDPSTATGVGDGSNMYFDVNVGIQYSIGNVNFSKSSASQQQFFSLDNPFWRGWFLQYGVDMTLYNPCEKDFSDAFSKGRTSGLDIALGKWFSPEIGVRGKMNWENALFENKSLEWLPYEEPDVSNYDGGGCVMLNFDVLLSAKHILCGYDENDRWDLYGFGRLGLGKNRSIDSLSPLVGAGFGTTYRINRHWSIYADTAYQGITSEFFSGVSWSGATGSAFNGIWDFNIGLQLNIGER